MSRDFRSESVLSDASLGLCDLENTSIFGAYSRKGFRVYKRRSPVEGSKRYSEVVVKPLKGWYPSKSGSFTFGIELDPDWIAKKIVPLNFNPAVWVHRKKGLLVLRVPKDRKKETHEKLYKLGFWYHTYKREWFLRRGKR
jgi:hypothetical protein